MTLRRSNMRWLWPEAQSDTDDAVRSPFDRTDLGERLLPFGIIAVVAELSILLPPGPQSTAGLVVSLVLLAAVALSFLLPWDDIPAWASVFVPLAYTGSVLALILATGESASGVGIVILIPLIWTALFHRRWESVCVVAAVVAVEIITALVPVALSSAIIARRAFFWTALGIVVSVAIHALRERQARAQARVVELNEQLARLAVFEDRDRIARELNQSIMQKMMSVGLNLASTTNLVADPTVRQRIQSAMEGIDESVRDLREAIYGVLGDGAADRMGSTETLPSDSR